MSPFRVEWEPAAEDELARLWLQSIDQQAITAAEAKADHLLCYDSFKYGNHLSEGLYRIDVPPLTFIYTIEPSNKLVVITWVRILS
jgi:hypothetical protein